MNIKDWVSLQNDEISTNMYILCDSDTKRTLSSTHGDKTVRKTEKIFFVF